jgi:hypothetical protein
MSRAKSTLTTTAAALALSAALGACGSSSGGSIPPSGRLIGATGGSVGRIVLSAVGAQRIGLETARARSRPAPAPIVKTTVVAGIKRTTTVRPPAPHGVIVPYSAVVYDPGGRTYVFTNPARLTYVETPIDVVSISGHDAYLSSGPKPGTRVVTVGAEELYGVQAGVLAQT